MISTILLFFILNFNVQAASFTESFNHRDEIESSTAVVNHELGVVHPTLRVMNFKGGFTPLDFDIGSGAHGSFELSTYANFSINQDLSGNIIRLDTSLYPTLNVTKFHLEPGWVLEPMGDAPLIIKSLSDVFIEGEIWCHGEDGTNAVNNTNGTGGSGRCGGSAGGNGGLPTLSGTNGSNINTNVTGGTLGNFTGGAAVGGGGGGSWNTTSNAGNGANLNGGGGQAGLSQADPEFMSLLGSAGGGGGSSTATQPGAGGGGGGGIVLIYTQRNFHLGTSPSSVTGLIRAQGGSGGSSNVQGGPGGGGGGGSVLVFVGGAIEVFNTVGTGASLVNGGIGGSNSLLVATANGGIGRHWYSSVSFNNIGTGFYTPAEQAPISPGNVEFHSSPQHVITKSVDLANTRTQILSLSTMPVSPDFVLQLSGSNDDFASDDSGWTTDFDQLAHKRYIKMKITITTSDVNNPTLLDAITFNFSQGNRDAFTMTSTSCATLNTKQKPTTPLLLLILPLFVILFFQKKRPLKLNTNI